LALAFTGERLHPSRPRINCSKKREEKAEREEEEEEEEKTKGIQRTLIPLVTN
jgi:hypothetical protein